MKLYELVKAQSDLSVLVKKGALGVVVMLHGDAGPFEVEFVDENRETLEILTVSLNDVSPTTTQAY